MACRLAEAFGTSPELWAGMQLQHDLYLAGKVQRPKIERMAAYEGVHENVAPSWTADQ